MSHNLKMQCIIDYLFFFYLTIWGYYFKTNTSAHLLYIACRELK